MTTFFEHQRTSYKRQYLKTLICLAASDGALDETERNLIFKIGMKRGLKSWQVERLMEEDSSHEVFLPESIANRMNLLYDIMLIIYADDRVSEAELNFITTIVATFKLEPTLVNQLLQLFEGQAPSTHEWTAFVESIDH